MASPQASAREPEPNDLDRLEQCVVRLITDDAVPTPPYPAVAARIVRLMQGEAYGLPQLVQTIALDQVIAAQLLRSANTANFAGLAPATTLPAAVGRLGAKEVQRIALAATLGTEASVAGPLGMLRRKAWRDSVFAAHLAAMLGQGRGLSADDMFLCGLLHDFGTLLGIRAFEMALAQLGVSNSFPAEVWAHVIARYHVELGMVLAARWKLPEQLQVVIASHHAQRFHGDHRNAVVLIRAVDVVVELLATQQSVSDQLLRGTALSRDERRLVAQAVPRLVSQVASFATGAGDAAQSAVSIPKALIGTPQRTVDVEAEIVSPAKMSPLRIVQVGAAGLLARAQHSVTAEHLLRVALALTPTQRLEMWVRPSPVDPSAGANLHLLKPFAMDPGTQARYVRWVRDGAA